MKKFFDRGDILLGLIQVIGINIGRTAAKELGFEGFEIEALACVTGGLFFIIGWLSFGKKVLKKISQNTSPYISVIIFYLICEGFAQYVLDVSILADLLNDFVWTLGMTFLTFWAYKQMVIYKENKVRKKHGDGGQGIIFDIDSIKEYQRNLYGKNAPINGSYDTSCSVKCTNGIFVGVKTKKVLAFKGIPYAKAPIGNRRWKKPEPCDTSEQVFAAEHFGFSPLQNPHNFIMASWYEQSEDCLTLNIWTNTKTKSKKKPVIVFFFGGNFSHGGSADVFYCGDEFVKKNSDVIFVTVNYRISLLGFLDLSIIPGGEAYPDSVNLGILDQIAALRWLHENIAAFGGDAERITIAGDSSGAVCASLLPLIPEAKGLFRRAIAISGGPGFLREKEQAREITRMLQQRFDLADMNDFLQLTTDDLQLAMKDLASESLYPIKDGRILPLDIFEAYKNGTALGVDLLFGNTKDEYRFYVGASNWEMFKNHMADTLTEVKETLSESEWAIVENFTAETDTDDLKQAETILNYLKFHTPSYYAARLHAAAGGKVFCFYWMYEMPLSKLGAVNGLPIAFLLGQTAWSEKFGIVIDPVMSRVFQRMIIEFATKGNPSLTTGELKHIGSINWPQFTTKNQAVLEIKAESCQVGATEVIRRAKMLEPLLPYISEIKENY